MPRKSIKIDGSKLAGVQEFLGLNQLNFAQALGMSKKNIQRITRKGEVNVYVGTFAKLAEFLKTTPDELEAALKSDCDMRIKIREWRDSKVTIIDRIREWSKEESARITAENSFESPPESTWLRIAKNNQLIQQHQQRQQRQHQVHAVPIPTFPLKVAAGGWVPVCEIARLRDQQQIDHGRFRIYVSGDSMQPKWPDGSLVEFVCAPDLFDADNIGRDFYIQKNNDDATFKRLVAITSSELVFMAINTKKYPKKMPVLKDDIVRMARAVFRLTPDE